MRALRFGVPFLFLASAPAGFLLGGACAFLTLVLTPLALTSFDIALGFDRESEDGADALTYRALLWGYIATQLAATIWATVMVTQPTTTPLAAVGLTVSIGLTSGIFGIVAAHEMVHSASRAERGLGLIFFAGLGYMHFRIAHVHGHHVRAATLEDPASARRGESAYAFVVRSVIGQAREAWTFERKRRQRQGRPVFGLGNRMLLYLVVELLVLAAAAGLGPAALAFWIGQAALAILLLELFNFIAHYGLARRRGAGGGYERLAARHSWNSTRRMNNWSLFNMGRHSDHHRRPTRAYQRLEPQRGAPELPSGYAGALLMSLFPPLWRRVMDPRVEAWMRQAREPA
jgi:alkane 1-monooxygenase